MAFRLRSGEAATVLIFTSGRRRRDTILSTASRGARRDAQSRCGLEYTSRGENLPSLNQLSLPPRRRLGRGEDETHSRSTRQRGNATFSQRDPTSRGLASVFCVWSVVGAQVTRKCDKGPSRLRTSASQHRTCPFKFGAPSPRIGNLLNDLHRSPGGSTFAPQLPRGLFQWEHCCKTFDSACGCCATTPDSRRWPS